jgi:tRNA(fMet)-specific endonuclease VapC
MTRYMLDTNIVSDLVRNPQGSAAAKLAVVGDGAVCTSIIVAAELRYGAARKGSARLSGQLDLILGALPVLPLEAPAEEAYAALRSRLESTGTPIGGNDMLIAAHALALGCVVVTDNQREFARVQGLEIENWLNRS